MDPMNPLDAEFVEVEDEDRHVSMAIGSIAVFEGPMPSYDEFVESITQRLPLVPRYRQKVRTTPLRIGPPCPPRPWIRTWNVVALPVTGSLERRAPVADRDQGHGPDVTGPGLW